MNEIERLLKNIKIMLKANALDAELSEVPENEIHTIEELNDWLEESMTYWEE